MKFSYTALSNDNQKLTGVLEAESLEVAQSELHKINLSIVSIDQISDKHFIEQKHKEVSKKEERGVKTFTFVASDNLGKEITGTIDAPDGYTAYKRLILEYHFTVLGLYPIAALTQDEKDLLKNKKKEWNDQLRAEGIEEIKGSAHVKGELDEEGTTVDKVIVDEIDRFIINTKKVLAEHKDQFSVPFLKQIEKTLSELERIRVSNNIKHISEICNQLYELISHPDRVPMEIIEQDVNAVYQGILSSMKNSTFVRKKGGIRSKAIEPLKKGFLGKIFKLLGKKTTKADNAPRDSQISGDSQEAKDFERVGFAKKITRIFQRDKSASKDMISLFTVIHKFFFFLSSPNAILRKARKQEVKKAYSTWKRQKKELKEQRAHAVDPSADYPSHSFFTELNSFVGWLLFFYIIYFFLVNFSLEKELGIPKDFVIQTLKSPLILNITIFLLFSHLLLRIKINYFNRNFLGSLFLFFFGFGLYTILIINY